MQPLVQCSACGEPLSVYGVIAGILNTSCPKCFSNSTGMIQAMVQAQMIEQMEQGKQKEEQPDKDVIHVVRRRHKMISEPA